ncbi:MAG TPA: GHKL domain-containing protein [Epsilonproteobacteria bacterium]|nr:GHKL domain-containing protein [Campylobacterota bacterium]
MIRSESCKIQKIVEELLQLSKYSKESIVQSFVPCDLNAILLETVDNYLAKAKEKNIDLKMIRFEKATKNASPELINAIFSNLIDNAIKYTLPGKKIQISLWEDKKIHFIVQDEGMGISQENMSKITDRFYRVDESRNKEIEGFGLGLSIVRNSIELHSGELQIKSELDIGTTVEVIL